MEPALTYEKRGHVAYLTLNRPEVRNAMNPEMIVRLAEAWVDYTGDGELRVAIITGAGDRAFCSGADLGRLIPLLTGARQPDDDWDRRLAGDLSLARTALLRGYPLYKPVISAINGHCLAGGTELMLAADIRIAAEHATFGLTEVTRGIIPAGGGIVRLPRQVPYCKAMEILLVGDSITAQEGHRAGLVNYVVPASELMATAEEFAAKIAANGPLAVRKTKEAVVRGVGLPLQDAERIEDECVVEVMSSEDAREGPRAFVEKRPPQYKGR
jgi:enoyl-CoA hydratase